MQPLAARAAARSLDGSEHRVSSILIHRVWFAIRCRSHRSLRDPVIAGRNIRVRRCRHVPNAVRYRRRRNVAVTGARPDRDSQPAAVSSGTRALGDAASLGSRGIAEAELGVVTPDTMQ